jgi:hypothetical protein
MDGQSMPKAAAGKSPKILGIPFSYADLKFYSELTVKLY